MSNLVSRSKIKTVAKQEGISPSVFAALVNQESGRQKHVGSPAGAQGPTQLMPATAKALGVNINDPIDNLRGGAKYFHEQLQTFGGNVSKALAAYNAGPGAVEKYNGVPPYAETQNYVKNILAAVGNPTKATAAPSAPASSPAAGIPSTTLSKKTTFDQAGYQQAQRASILGQMLAKTNPNSELIRLGVTPTATPNAADFQVSKLQETTNQPGINNPKAAAPVVGSGVGAIVKTANKINKLAPDYVWGGGHQANPKITDGLDCSGAVSYALNSAGLLKGSLVSGALAKYGKPGKGKQVTIYANDEHTFLKIGNRYWGTSGTWRPNGGAGWFTGTPPASYLAKFTARHPAGY